MTPEHAAAVTRAIIEETAVLVSLGLCIATILVWAIIIAEKMS